MATLRVQFLKMTCDENGSSDQQHSFAADLATRIENALMPRTVVLDGEIVCLDNKGCPQFNDLLFRRGTPSFVAFDLLFDRERDTGATIQTKDKRKVRFISDALRALQLSAATGELGRRELQCGREQLTMGRRLGIARDSAS